MDDEVREAATVALVRDTPHGLETWMMRRRASMQFAARAWVFPGGRVDADDHGGVSWTGAGPAVHADRMGIHEDAAQRVVISALRELYEETGVLLGHHGVLDDALRVAVEQRDTTFAEALATVGATLDADLVVPLARWVTPPTESRRFDTWFFVADCPDLGPSVVSGEADVAGWVAPRDVLDQHDRREALVLPPTLAMLITLDEAGRTAAVMDRARLSDLAAVHPEVVVHDDGSAEVVAAGRRYAVTTTAPVSR